VGVSRDCPNFLGTLLISGKGKATDFEFGQYIQRVHPSKIPLKILEKRGRGRIQGLPNFFSGTPYYLRNGKSYGFQIWPVHSEGPSEQKPIKNFREKGVWGYPRTARFFGATPYIISGTGKATNFKFCVHIYGLNRNKSPLKNLGKVAMGVVKDSRKFSGLPSYTFGASRGHLCNTSAFLYTVV